MEDKVLRGWVAVEYATVMVVKPDTHSVEVRKGCICINMREHAFIEKGGMKLSLSLDEYAVLMKEGRVAVTPKAVTYVIVLPVDVEEVGGGTGLMG